MDIYLVQRATIRTEKPSEIEGIDSLLSYNYMGSSEFEFGALPKALKVACASLPSFGIFETGLKRKDGKRLFIVAQEKDKVDIQDFLNGQATGKRANLKERTDLQGSLAQEEYSRADCWWDIENNWFAVIGKQNAENLLFALEKVKAKKGW